MRITKSKEERRAELTDIAAKLFDEQGYGQVKVSDIVKEAQVAQGTFYYHFKTKEEVLYAVLERTIQGMANHLNALATNQEIPVQNRFELIMSQLFSPLDTDSSIFKLMQNTDKIVHSQLDALRRDLIAPIICELVQEGITQKVFLPLANTQVISMIIFDGINEQMHRLYEENQSPNQLMATIAGVKELFKLVLGIDLSFKD